MIGFFVLDLLNYMLMVRIKPLFSVKKRTKKIRSILKKTRCCHLKTKIGEEQNLLTVLEELKDLVKYKEVEIDELEGRTIQN